MLENGVTWSLGHKHRKQCARIMITVLKIYRHVIIKVPSA